MSLATGICAALGLATGLGLSAGGCAYAALWPGSRLFGKALIAPRRPGELALTFDDGPNPVWTPRMLEVLAAHDVRATFFLLGKYAQEQPALVRQIAAAGHLVGSHSFSHLNLALTGAIRVREELQRGKEAVETILGEPVRFFRPPFGARRPYVLHAAREMGMTPALWNAMTSDWSATSAESIAERLSAKIDRLERRGWAANIVLHDGGHLDPAAERGPSVGAARMLLDRFGKTHRFVRLDCSGWN